MSRTVHVVPGMELGTPCGYRPLNWVGTFTWAVKHENVTCPSCRRWLENPCS